MKSPRCFPKSFLWGAATAAHQVEGNNHNQWTEWEKRNAEARAKKPSHNYPEAKQPDNYISGNACDHYKKYKSDFELLKKMNMNAYRFSIEWSRIEPNEGEWDVSEIKYYNEYIDELIARGVEPIVTLFHFTLPNWFADKGGFARRSNLKYYYRYVEKIISEINPRVRYIITINEPEIYATFGYLAKVWPPAKGSIFTYWRVIRNLALAHNEASKLIHSKRKNAKVSIAKNSCHFHPGDNSMYSKFNVKMMRYLQDYYYLNKVIGHCDFLGLNYYFSVKINGHTVSNSNEHLSDLRWDMHPGDIQYVSERLYNRYKKPILITENGLADSRDQYRKWWIEQTLEGMQKATGNGVKLIGYLHWSLLDNFEWAYGKWPRFGLAETNYETGERTLRKSALWFGKQIKRLKAL